MAQIIQIKRRIPGTGTPPSGTGAGQVRIGELATTIDALGAGGVANLYIGDGTYVHPLVSAARQVELTGNQSIAGNKTFTGEIIATPANLNISGGNDGDVLSTDGAGDLAWIAPPKGVEIGPTPPATPDAGDVWYNTTNNELRVWNGTAWVISNITVAAAAPGAPSGLGRAWLNSTTDVLSIWNGTAWVAVTGNRSATGAAAPTPAVTGDIWWSSTGPQVYDGSAFQAATLPGFAGVATEPPISGDGTTTTPLGVTMATTPQINGGTNDVYPIDALGLRSQLGDAVANLTTSNKTIVPAINELDTDIGTLSSQLAALSGALRFVGNYDADQSEVVSADAGTLTVGNNLPTAATANQGWFVIVTEAGTPTAPAENVRHEVGDWIVSTGTAWIHIPLYHTAITAANVGVTAINSTGWTNVQAALAGLYALAGTALSSVAVDGISIVGDGTVGDELEVGTVDGGTF